MVATRWTLAAVLAATAVSASTDELQFIARLLKRQDPGTPAYNCHDNCGSYNLRDTQYKSNVILTLALESRSSHYSGTKQCRRVQ